MALGPVTPPPELLPGMPTRPGVRIELTDLNDKMAFGAIPKYFADTWNAGSFDERASVDVTSNQLERTVLLGKGSYAVDGISLDASEYNRVVRSPEAFIRHIGATSVAASDKKMDTNPDRVAGKERQHILDAIRQKGLVHATMVAATQNEIDSLTKLLGCIAEPGRAMMKGEELVALAAQANDFYFARLLRVVGYAQKWNTERTVAARHAMRYRLTQGPQSERVQYWGELAQVAKKYATARNLLFVDRRARLRTLWLQTNAGASPQSDEVRSTASVPEVQ